MQLKSEKMIGMRVTEPKVPRKISSLTTMLYSSQISSKRLRVL